MRASTAPAHRRARPAFTLVEMLAVIVIIALLVAILVPAVASARRAAREASSRATFASLETGLQTFKAEARIGGTFPPSATDDPEVSQGSPFRLARNPYADLPNYSGADPLNISGAGLLVWALAGADLLGTPGFKVFDTSASPPRWSNDTHANYNSGNPILSGAYALYPSGDKEGQEVHARSGPYIDLSKIRVSTWDSNLGSFAIEAEVEATGGSAPGRDYPMFLDAFGYPILYYRADPAGVQMTDRIGNEVGNERGIYHWSDNRLLVFGSEQLVLRAGAERHKLDYQPRPPGSPSGKRQYDPGFFQYYIENQDVQVRNEPHRPRSDLLITAGADGVYGTADDITNFPHNGR